MTTAAVPRTAILVMCLLATEAAALAQGQPYRSPFSESYQLTTGALLPTTPGLQSGCVTCPPEVGVHGSIAGGAWMPRYAPEAGTPACTDPVLFPPNAIAGQCANGANDCFSGSSNFVPGVSGYSGVLSGTGCCDSAATVTAGHDFSSVVCDICACGPCDDAGKRFAFDVSSVLVFRDHPRGQVMFFNPASVAERIDASHFSPGGAAGVESGVTFFGQSTPLDFEFRTMWLDDWDSRVAQRFTGPSVQVVSNPILGTTGPRNGAAYYGSRLGSIELNARRRLCWRGRKLTLVGGLRHIRLNENLNTTLSDPAGIIPDELTQTRVNNRLWGLQLGVDSVLVGGKRFCLKMNSRVGLMGNNTDQRTQLISLASPPVAFTARGSGGELALLVESGVSGKIRLSSCANLVAGYRVIYLDGLTLAPEQLAASAFLTGSGRHTNGDMLLHAANVGLEISY